MKEDGWRRSAHVLVQGTSTWLKVPETVFREFGIVNLRVSSNVLVEHEGIDREHSQDQSRDETESERCEKCYTGRIGRSLQS